MQPTIQEPDQSHKSRIDEDNINFRPSPNFKHMKKYLMSKFEEENQNASAAVQENPAIQPPLPPNPPPPTYTCRPILIPKTEIEDDDLPCAEELTEVLPSEETVNTDDTEEPNGVKEIMCRNFIRGTCKRGTSCIFAHKMIMSQLPGVYTFCKNFQNSLCTLPKCKFVHATVFEKENFFRTGFLPPHAMGHLKDVNVYQAAPPPPPLKDTQVEMPVFSKPPPLLPPSIPPVPVISCAPANPEVFQTVTISTSPSKRGWSDSEDFSSSPRDFEGSEPLVKKCKTCDNNEFRYQYNKNKIEKMLRTSDEMKKKFSQLNKKMMKLCTVISVLIRPMVSSKGVNGINNMSHNGDNDKTLLEPFNLLLAANNRLTMINEDNNKKSSFSNLLAKLLLNSADPTKSPNAS